MIDTKAFKQFAPVKEDHYRDEYDGTASVELTFRSPEAATKALRYAIHRAQLCWARLDDYTIALHETPIYK